MKKFAANNGIIEVNQGKGFVISILVHSLIVAVIFLVTSNIQQAPSLMVCDFSIIERCVNSPDNQLQSKKQAVPAAPVAKLPEKLAEKPVKATPKPQKAVAKKPKTIPVPKPEIAAVKQKKPLPVEPEPLAEVEEQSSQSEMVEVASQAQEEPEVVAQTAPLSNETAEAAEKPKFNFPAPAAGRSKASEDRNTVSRYTKAHFSLIQQGIQQRINYPRTARRMGWEGKVVVTFVVCVDGSIKDIDIVESSGFKALDKNAVSTIKRAAPFPIPPIPAKLIVPVVYRLS